MREKVVAWAVRREVTTISRILESVRRRTITLKEEGESWPGLPGLSWTMPRACLREEGWKPWASRGSSREGRREGLSWWTDFQPEYGMWLGPVAEVFEDLEKALETSSEVTGV